MAATLAPSETTTAVATPPRILVFDSGLGGLTVFAEMIARRPSDHYVYAADDAAFPYGRLTEAALVERVMDVTERLIEIHRPDLVVIACNTASTLVLPPLRARWPAIPFVGTVPAIKPAAEASRSRIVSVLGTSGTVARDYTMDLIHRFAADCDVTLVGAKRLAGLAEAAMRGEAVDDATIAAEIAPAFVERDGQRTDTLVLACTHYPLLIDAMRRLAPWPVAFIDPAAAIARRVDDLLAGSHPARSAAPAARAPVLLFTSRHQPGPALRRAVSDRGFGAVEALGWLTAERAQD